LVASAEQDSQCPDSLHRDALTPASASGRDSDHLATSPVGRGVDRISGLESSSNLSLHLLPDPPPSRLGQSQPHSRPHYLEEASPCCPLMQHASSIRADDILHAHSIPDQLHLSQIRSVLRAQLRRRRDRRKDNLITGKAGMKGRSSASRWHSRSLTFASSTFGGLPDSLHASAIEFRSMDNKAISKSHGRLRSAAACACNLDSIETGRFTIYRDLLGSISQIHVQIRLPIANSTQVVPEILSVLLAPIVHYLEIELRYTSCGRLPRKHQTLQNRMQLSHWDMAVFFPLWILVFTHDVCEGVCPVKFWMTRDKIATFSQSEIFVSVRSG
ncbi:hypothetical protein KCV06_g94, partial [Aureobasidium melanogenum]